MPEPLYTISHPPAPADVVERFNKFIEDRAHNIELITAFDVPSPGFSLSLALFTPTTSTTNTDTSPDEPKGTWGLLISHPAASESLPDQAKYGLRASFNGTPPQPFSTSSPFIYAFASRLRFGRFISPHGTLLAPAPSAAGTDTIVGALYRSSDPRHGGAEVTVGGTVVRMQSDGQRRLCGLALGLVWNGQPKRERVPPPLGFEILAPFQNFPVLERGEGEVRLAPLEGGLGVVEDWTVDAGLYRDLGPAMANEGKEGMLLGWFGLVDGCPWVPIRGEEGVDLPRMNRLSTGEEILLGEMEPDVGSELYVATAAGWGGLPRCILGEDVKVHVYPAYNQARLEARRLKLIKPSVLSPRDVGAWILEKTDAGLRAFYQIVAVGEPDEVYAIPIKDVLQDVARGGGSGAALFPGTMDNASFAEAYEWMKAPSNLPIPKVVGPKIAAYNWEAMSATPESIPYPNTMPGRYPSLSTLQAAQATVHFSIPALRLKWRIHILGPASAQPLGLATPQLRTEWRVMNRVPGTDSQPLDAYEHQDFDAMEPFTPFHPIAASPLTEPPVGFLDLSLGNLQDLEDEIWPDQHFDCSGFDADPPPEACDECGVPAYRAPSPRRIGAGGEGHPFVTVGDYVRGLGAWLESEPVARDVHRYLSALENDCPVGRATAIPNQHPQGLEGVRFTVFTDFEGYEKSSRTEYARLLKRSVDDRKGWVERSWAIAEAAREK
ncbi:hypothetical protein QBC39DRAFT_380305 [Podospora conica]|nr:hypothetical protein QBC39DRAFT_380305 [Schizothecium conicum]